MGVSGGQDYPIFMKTEVSRELNFLSGGIQIAKSPLDSSIPMKMDRSVLDPSLLQLTMGRWRKAMQPNARIF